MKFELRPRVDNWGNRSHKLNIASNRPINKEEIQDIFLGRYGRFSSLIKVSEDWQIISPTDEIKNNSSSWAVIEII